MEFKHKYCLGERVYCDDGFIGFAGFVEKIYLNDTDIFYEISDKYGITSHCYKEEYIFKEKKPSFFLLLYLKLGLKLIKLLKLKVLKEKYEIESTPDEILETIKKI
jgi:hypothetical protein